VLECAWDDLLKKVRKAEDLDHIVSAHQEFLETINTRSLLDPQSSVGHPLILLALLMKTVCDFQKILTQLRTIFDLIIKFQKIQEGLYQAAMEELEAREKYARDIQLQQEKVRSILYFEKCQGRLFNLCRVNGG
jgi:gamma-tubulin complex component 3